MRQGLTFTSARVALPPLAREWGGRCLPILEILLQLTDLAFFCPFPLPVLNNQAFSLGRQLRERTRRIDTK
jgi:hypothetical protein